MSHTISTKMEVWKRYNDQISAVQIAEDMGLSVSYVDRCINQMRTDQIKIFKMQNQNVKFDKIIDKCIDFSAQFILITTNKKLKSLAKKLNLYD